jgi:hypothetical protein
MPEHYGTHGTEDPTQWLRDLGHDLGPAGTSGPSGGGDQHRQVERDRLRIPPAPGDPLDRADHARTHGLALDGYRAAARASLDLAPETDPAVLSGVARHYRDRIARAEAILVQWDRHAHRSRRPALLAVARTRADLAHLSACGPCDAELVGEDIDSVWSRGTIAAHAEREQVAGTLMPGNRSGVGGLPPGFFDPAHVRRVRAAADAELAELLRRDRAAARAQEALRDLDRDGPRLAARLMAGAPMTGNDPLVYSPASMALLELVWLLLWRHARLCMVAHRCGLWEAYS